MHERELDLDLRVERCDDDIEGLHRVIGVSELARSGGLAEHRHGLVTGLSVVVTCPEPEASEQVAAVTASAPPEMRVELVLCDPSVATTARLDLLAWPWSVVPAGPDRGSVLDLATGCSAGEFLVFGSEPVAGVGPRFDGLSDALGLMWVNGADAMVLDQSPSVPDGAGAGIDDGAESGADRRAGVLASVLGLRRGPTVGVVILRRWVARFLFDELGRAIDAGEELGERVRLLELRLIEVRDPT